MHILRLPRSHSQLADKYKKQGMTLNSFLRIGEGFIHYLTMHHDFEEAHLFPRLAKKIPSFRAIKAHRKAHKTILDDNICPFIYHNALVNVKANPKEYDPEAFREVLDSFRDTLFEHLDEEVNDLGAENMRKYWSLQEVRKLS
ncbi:hypothetical protein M422DRAFT_158684 [Sphaerobolus stellatus SS14]|nr:hypothetical protein M422DRAFT_158684 [Sphaerobolus stellatus SS14]